MNRWWQQLVLVSMLLGVGAFFCVVRAQVTAVASVKPRPVPQLQPPKSPVGVFRDLLAMGPADREKFLAARPPETRKRIQAKLDEYMALSPEERQLRLRVTELHWYLLPLMKMSPTNRAEQLAKVPAGLREAVAERLETWDIFPPTLKEDMLANEIALRYFIQPDMRDTFQRTPAPLPDGIQRWQSMSDTDRRSLISSYNQFFDLTPEEQKRAFEAFPESEQREMETTLQVFKEMTPEKRAECLQAFAKFAGMSETDKQRFLGNAELWRQMSPEDRQQWRQLVKEVPDWAPLPIGFVPPGASNAVNGN